MPEHELKLKPLIVLNFEGTVADFAIKNALLDISEHYGNKGIAISPDDPLRKHRDMLTEWFKGKTPIVNNL